MNDLRGAKFWYNLFLAMTDVKKGDGKKGGYSDKGV
jgi:hypothetical protein